MEMDRISIVEAKRNLSRIINTVAFGHEPIVLTSRGKAKAVLLGYEDFLKNSQGSSSRVIRLGGLWKGTRPISYEELRKIRRLAWRSLIRR